MIHTPMRATVIAVALWLCGTGVSFAQLAPGMTPGTRASGMPGTGMRGTGMPGTGMPGTGIPGMPSQPGMPVAAPGPGTALTPLGGIGLNLGSIAAPPQAAPMGTIGACGAPGIATSPTSAPSVAAFQAAGGIIPPTPAGAAPAFGTSSLSGACNPIVPGSALDTTTPPDPNTAANFVNGALPTTAVETGSGGLSPSVAVPPPTESPFGVGAVQPTNTGQSPLATLRSGPATSLVPVLPQPPVLFSSGCTGTPCTIP
jgi:hypothetical protein